VRGEGHPHPRLRQGGVERVVDPAGDEVVVRVVDRRVVAQHELAPRVALGAVPGEDRAVGVELADELRAGQRGGELARLLVAEVGQVELVLLADHLRVRHGEHQRDAGLAEAAQLGDGGVEAIQVLEALEADDRVGVPRLESVQVLDGVGLLEAHAVDVGERAARRLDGLGRDVDAGHLAPLGGEDARAVADAAAEVDDAAGRHDRRGELVAQHVLGGEQVLLADLVQRQPFYGVHAIALLRRCASVSPARRFLRSSSTPRSIDDARTRYDIRRSGTTWPIQPASCRSR
jgi:hypothetical protein